MYKVFKFGGASIKSAEAIKNIAQILRFSQFENLAIVVSAMGKSTNALEALLHASRNQDASFSSLFQAFKDDHLNICHDLFGTCPESLRMQMAYLFEQLELQLDGFIDQSYDFHYDQSVVFGELLSSCIIGFYLKAEGFDIQIAEARDLIITDAQYRRAAINWEATTAAIEAFACNPASRFFITQGFIGRNEAGMFTTLGREGSDFTAAILANCLNASEVTIWKDVPGLLNADPKRFENTVKIDQISYQEAIELAYYGATIMHPKTIKPLQNKCIPLYIRSFIDPLLPPSVIHDKAEFDAAVASYIVKDNQMLLSIRSKDFSFMDEQLLHHIFGKMHQLGMHAHLVQSSALSLSVCLDHQPEKLDLFIRALPDYAIRYNTGLQLLTIRHYGDLQASDAAKGREILLEQRSRLTLQLVLRV